MRQSSGETLVYRTTEIMWQWKQTSHQPLMLMREMPSEQEQSATNNINSQVVQGMTKKIFEWRYSNFW